MRPYLIDVRHGKKVLPTRSRTLAEREDWEGRFNVVFTAIGVASTALRVTTVQTRHAPVHHHHRGSIALGAKLGAGGELGLGEGVLLFGSGFEFGALFGDELFLAVVELVLVHQADGDQVLFDDFADFRGE